MASKSEPKNGFADVANVEEMAKMAYMLLTDLGYTTTQHEFNERLFIIPNNEAFVFVFQFLLPLLDRKEYRERFKFVLRVDDKRKEAEFRKVLCNYLQDLAKTGELGWDVPPIKMALFTTPGRSTFLHVLLCVIEAVLRRNASSLGLVLAPMGESIEALRTGTEFYQTQLAANEQLATDCRTQMQSQIESLAEELKRNEEAVERSREELRRAQQQEKVLDSDQRNLERFSASVNQLIDTSSRLARLLHLVADGDQTVDVHQLIELPNKGLIAACPELQPMVIELETQMTSGQVDLVLYLRLLNTMIIAFKPLYDDVLGKMTAGSTIQELIEQQRSFLKRADNTLSRVDDLIQEKEAVFAKNIRPEKAADWLEARDEPEAITYAIYPPAADDLISLYQLTQIPDLQKDGKAPTEKGVASYEIDGLMNPPKGTLRRRKLNMSNLRSRDNLTSCSDLSGIVPLERFESTPRIAHLKKDDLGQRRRRSIKDIFTSTPIPR
ncbi:uncharacterized protein LOC111269847 [Varroa jacobsoni]|uniref:uncharacterized protein LOC111269847 n=1 Tax=Varroa jacobsoni TaxID=62625 RepID=UPI000BF70FC4|nr:uncharacterized protein LOC111269847 [Varroa jacobsoni]XP_022705447.1 uncharacterized protein LOC111269847 [Varroa jacobsoni]